MTKERLTYHLPPLGNAAITLHDESASLYRSLQLAGEVARLNKLDHLGLVRVAFSGAHHPRWEYVVTILHLIERAKDSSDIHLNTPLVLPSEQRVSSGSELLRCWALLSNVGHLYETFSAERAFLDEIAESRSARREFLGAFATDPARAWAERLITERRTYSFFQALTLLRLRSLSEALLIPKEKREFWEEIFFLYVLGGGDDQLVLLKRIYRNLRRLAYLGLDSHYTPAVIGLDLHQVVSDVPAFTKLVLRDDASETEDDDLEGLERYLYREFYMGEAVLAAVAAREFRLRAAIRRSLQSIGFAATLDGLARNAIQESIVAEDLETVVRLPGWSASMTATLLFEEVDIRPRRRLADSDTVARERGVRIVWWQAAYGGDWVLQTHARANDLDARAYALAVAFGAATSIAEDVYTQWRNSFSDDLLQAWSTERHATQLIEAALKLIFGADIRWEWRRLRGETTALLAERKFARERMRRDMARAGTPRARADELRAVSILLRRRPDDFVASTAVNILGYEGAARAPIVELDGVLVELGGDGEVRVTLVEAKRKRTGVVGAATRDLNTKVARLQPREGVSASKVSAQNDGQFGYAWVTFRAGSTS